MHLNHASLLQLINFILFKGSVLVCMNVNCQIFNSDNVKARAISPDTASVVGQNEAILRNLEQNSHLVCHVTRLGMRGTYVIDKKL